MLAQSGLPATVSPWLIVASQVVLGILIAPVVNGLFTFGEEFGWRGYLQPKLMPVGVRKTFVLMGLIWGVWHWPIIAMGHNYGLDYPGVPWLGLLGMVWFAFVTGTFLGWISWRGGSVWPAVIGHGALNGIANLGVLFVQGQPNPLLGPLPVGVIASIPWTIVALWILFSPRALAVSGSQHAAVPLGSSSG
jgi:membrane protease YdiL (CAAX protease family)